MELFLVCGVIRFTPYMSDSHKIKNDVRLVKALNSSQALEKYRDYWDNQGDGEDSYWVQECQVTETLE